MTPINVEIAIKNGEFMRFETMTEGKCKKRVQNPRKRKGEGELMYEVRYAQADLYTGYTKEAIGNLCAAIVEAKKEFPLYDDYDSFAFAYRKARQWWVKWFGDN